MRALLRWACAALLLVALIVAVGTIVAYLYGGATLTALTLAAAVAVAVWHALRRLGPRPASEGFEELPPAESLFVVGLIGVVILIGIWSLPAGALALLALHLFARRAA